MDGWREYKAHALKLYGTSLCCHLYVVPNALRQKNDKEMADMNQCAVDQFCLCHTYLVVKKINRKLWYTWKSWWNCQTQLFFLTSSKSWTSVRLNIPLFLSVWMQTCLCAAFHRIHTSGTSGWSLFFTLSLRISVWV